MLDEAQPLPEHHKVLDLSKRSLTTWIEHIEPGRGGGLFWRAGLIPSKPKKHKQTRPCNSKTPLTLQSTTGPTHRRSAGRALRRGQVKRR